MMVLRKSRTGSRHAFTLIELVIATAVSAIVLLAISATFFSALQLNNTTHQALDRDVTLQHTLDVARNDLAGIMLPGGVLSGQLQTTLGSSVIQDLPGERISPDFYTTTGTIDGWNPFSEAQIVAYSLVPATDGSDTKNLVRVVVRNLIPAQTATSDQQVLLSGLTDASVDFFDGNDWTDTWDSSTTSTLPNAIRFQIALAPVNRSQPAPAPVEIIVPVPVVTRTSLAQSTASTGG